MAFTTTEVGATQDDIILSIVQEERLSRAVVRPTVNDMSSQAVKGIDEIKVPRISAALGAPSVQNPDGVTAAPFQTLDLATDSILLNQWKNLPYRLPDRVSIQNRVNLEAEIAKSAGKQMAIDQDEYVIALMRTTTQSVTLSGAGGAGLTDAITIADINRARADLKKQNVTDLDGQLFLLVSVEQEKNMLDIANFIQADQYGSREALLNGEIGKIYGMRVLVSNLLVDFEAFAYHRSCISFAAQKDTSFERQRADVTLQAWEYSFSNGYGASLMDAGERIVKFVDGTP